MKRIKSVTASIKDALRGVNDPALQDAYRQYRDEQRAARKAKRGLAGS